MLKGLLKTKFLLSCLALLAAMAAVGCGDGSAPKDTPISASTYWPTEGWKSSTPELQGMDSELLLGMLNDIQERETNIHSVLIVRNGHLVLEAYFDPYDKDTSHVVHSVTKSITSGLVGISIREGYINGVDQLVLDQFPERTVANLDPAKQAMTLEHLLTMTSGLDWPEIGSPYVSPSNPVGQMLRSPDFVQFVLDRPMDEEPGTTFNYNSGASHLLSAIIQSKTGASTLSFAQEHLFGPLGISSVYWPSDPGGISSGGFGIRMTPRDMAKFGYLYLNDGLWDGVQIVPDEWVETSTKTHSVESSLYGYQWWIDSEYYWARGILGQHIVVVPNLDMVVVFTSELTGGSQPFSITSLLDNFVFKAAESTKPLAANPEGVTQLESKITKLRQPEPKLVPSLPETAQNVSGNTYLLEAENAFGSFAPSLDWRSLSFEFQAGEMEALLKLSFGNGQDQWELPVGLENAFRVTQVEGFGPVALKGFWQDDKTFVLQNQLLGTSLWAGLQSDIRLEFRFTFEEDGVDIRLNSRSLLLSLSTRGELRE